ncbi:hypothetical protein BH23GEM10_BH23GEM10_00340 [soil metagenome]
MEQSGTTGGDQLALFDGVGHLPPSDLRIPAIRDFLDRRLQ